MFKPALIPIIGQLLRSIYTNEELWYDTRASLAEQRRLHPGDVAIANQWENLLKSEGLERIAGKPLVNFVYLSNDSTTSPRLFCYLAQPDC